MHERFDYLSEEIGLSDEKNGSFYEQAIRGFFQSEIQLAIAKREQEIIWMIEDLRGFPACVLSEEQAKEIIDLITREE